MKYNMDGASRGNLGARSFAFYLRDERGDIRYAQGAKITDTINMDAEAYFMLQEAIHYGISNLNKVIFQMNSLIMIKVLSKELKYPWHILEHSEKIIELFHRKQVRFQHIMTERNQMADYLPNTLIDKEGFSITSF